MQQRQELGKSRFCNFSICEPLEIILAVKFNCRRGGGGQKRTKLARGKTNEPWTNKEQEKSKKEKMRKTKVRSRVIGKNYKVRHLGFESLCKAKVNVKGKGKYLANLETESQSPTPALPWRLWVGFLAIGETVAYLLFCICLHRVKSLNWLEQWALVRCLAAYYKFWIAGLLPDAVKCRCLVDGQE